MQINNYIILKEDCHSLWEYHNSSTLRGSTALTCHMEVTDRAGSIPGDILILCLCDYMPLDVSEKHSTRNAGILKKKLFWQMNELSLDDFAADDHFNSALLSNYGVMWVILSEHVDSCCLLIHSKQTQLGVGRQCTANRDRESGSFTLSPLMSVFFKKTLSITRGSPSLLSLIRSSVSKKKKKSGSHANF